MKTANLSDIAIWREKCLKGYAYSVGVVTEVTETGVATHAKTWCFGIGKPSFQAFKIQGKCHIASASALNAPSEEIVRNFHHASTLDEVKAYLAPYRGKPVLTLQDALGDSLRRDDMNHRGL